MKLLQECLQEYKIQLLSYVRLYLPSLPKRKPDNNQIYQAKRVKIRFINWSILNGKH